MNDRDFVALLQWAAPRLGLRWRGFKNVRRQVHRRVSARMKELRLDAALYRDRLEADPEELRLFGRLAFVTISRFYRDHRVYDALRDRWLPELAARSTGSLRVWSAGCASGEEPYSVMLVWRLCVAERFPSVRLEIVAQDFDDVVLERARAGLYEEGSLRELPRELRDRAFTRDADLFRVHDDLRRDIGFVQADVRTFVPSAPVDLVLARNLVFTYLDEDAQRSFLQRVASVLASDGLLIVGSHEVLPPEQMLFAEIEPLVHRRQVGVQ